MGRTLGLDLGTNSIGWALVEEGAAGTPGQIVAAGVRIFQEAVDAKTRLPKNQARRAARALRRVLARRQRRKQRLRSLLVSAGLLPPEVKGVAPERVFNDLGSPYELRKRGLDGPLQPQEFGRVLTHLCARRGFQSNRKSLLGTIAQDFEDLIEAAHDEGALDRDDRAARREAEKEEGIVKAQIATLRSEMTAAGARTLGEYLADLPPEEHRRRRYTDRAMFREEFEALWEKQKAYLPALRDDGLKARIQEAIFFQRPLASAKRLVGRCSLEPSRRRAALARLESQRFRMLQEVNHLAIRDPATGRYRDLDTPQREALLAILSRQRSMTWGAARKALKLHRDEVFNTEEGGRDKLKGDTTSAALHATLGEAWDALPGRRRLALVEDLLTIGNKAHLVRRLREHWAFSREQQYRLAILELEPGYLSHSLKAINRMLPALEAGAKYYEAKLAAGYREVEPVRTVGRLGRPPLVRNPVVQRTLHEVRKVVNGISRVYGVPEVVRIEMARDLKMGPAQLATFTKQQRANEKANDRAREQLTTVGIAQARRDDLIKYRLWEECGGECPYTGRPIAMHQLFSADVDVEHIIPYARCLDDSYMNKTLCFADENRMRKRGHTPWEVYGSNAAQWELLMARVRRLPPPKRKRFVQDRVDELDDFISRQLNDTRFLSVEVKNYVAALGAEVQVTKGSVTAQLRRLWDVNRILGVDPETKTRTDHRHHALDALVIACTGRPVYQRLASAAGRGYEQVATRHGSGVGPPWPTFGLNVADAIEKIVVSHAPNRRLAGAFHEQTAYGLRASTGLYHYRKRLDPAFSAKSVESIADPVVQRLIRERLEQHGNDPKKAFALALLHSDGKTPIRSVRLTKSADAASVMAVRNAEGHAYKFYDLGNNHHIEILEQLSGHKRVGRVVSTLEAAKRVRHEQRAEVDRDGGPGLRFVMSLMINDMVEVSAPDGPAYYRVQKISNDTGITLRRSNAATLDFNHERLLVRPNTLRGRKVTVDAIGHVRYASD
jgi:CRISPR-associated endonuclease Csn1